MAFEIRKGIPLPARKSGKTGQGKYADLALLEIGDMAFIPNPGKTAQIAISKAAKGLGISVQTRKLTETVDGVEVNGLGVWRVAPKVEAEATA
jgi:hypothetical protein